MTPPLEVALDDPKTRVGAKTRTASGNALLVAEAGITAEAKSKAKPQAGAVASAQQSALRAPNRTLSALIGAN